MEDELAIRPYELRDEASVVRLWGLCALRVPHNDPYEDIKRKLCEQPELFLIGELGGSVVATCMAGYEGHRGCIYYFGTHPDFQNKGIGKQMMSEAERLLLERGCPKINLMIRETNLEVIDFYENLGYKKDPVVVFGKRLIPDN